MALEQVTEKNNDRSTTSTFFMLPNFVLSLIEHVLNQALKLDPKLSKKLNEVKELRLVVEVRDWQQTIQLVFADKKLHLYTAQSSDNADCMISADIDTLIALKNPAMLTQLIRQDKLDLQGDLNIAQTYSNAFSSLDIDWPEQLSKHIGDGPAQQLYLHLTSLKQQSSKVKKQLATTLTSLCQDELAITIHPLELEQFKQQNRVIKSQVAAIEQRINALLNIVTR
ncbi:MULTISPECIES: ubiquinone biosynthesis accessory factor UbiJ [Pseudoalteromonas]|uniref:Ubiquinone biosynthesis accessory factor UbiJ n=1 Tax=Pseudoalteromonas fuliginea TaxID=1872678 RepID=A0ABQ6RLN3_9GAMM|nr:MULTISPECIES: SCP2 sterol-binding domain-containing protein [Pseudoalteromonas]ALQ09601.1 ubiquinone carrier protein [Pseudoalteromonas sp. Bsw20308]ATG76138.1 ubiquinone carrier protein [Pseudoalteromonas sp. 1_2015MBL_MicDiv]KAA1162664.1 ubiquinone carrier protein [Pseudoalteromonas fuliginea]KAA1168596.1 ubiquinone carrier protein [Pseudoalteromonas fuliginea]KDC54950.1 ubiquinone carrier protein [Pseudoalteromonas sp. S3431]